ncbi:site-specific tyrosine recombinase XerC [Serratia marcescens]|nr:site-specific tyrosine recombinase XerC [Serratia marcescens]CVB17047.1 site-specific tyrosine recombinase XerC [Serratia marcescens]CVB29967.1 site-specific tyrosine recombinase XerC [Serratia marcescens]CVB35865.1 site-specific tyrosine recombinase XerC [Serratia marcescens]CVB79161.1 site-specific tyrosine recombinase XerC [Serratia marcescens]
MYFPLISTPNSTPQIVPNGLTMAYYSIEKRTKADGTVRYRCTVGVREKGVYLFRENRTFSKQALAKTWGINRVAELEKNGIPNSNDTDRITVAELIQKYLDDPETGGKAGKDKSSTLRMLLTAEFSFLALSKLQANDIIDHCRRRVANGASPSTVSHDLSYLGTVLKAAKPIYGISYTANPIDEAKPLLAKMRLISKSNRRTRRPDENEIDVIVAALQERQNHPRSRIPFVDIFNFSILSCMRVGEVCRIEWSDIDYVQKSVLVRDRKDPRKKAGNHMSVPLLGEAWAIVMRQERVSKYIFPYNSKSISAAFIKVREKTGIDDLHYHDLKREGASRLFEAGFSIEEVAQVTGHKNLNTLWQVYTELYPKSLHEKFDLLKKSKGK